MANDRESKPGATDLEPLMKIEALAEYLRMNVGSVYNMLSRITEADGKVHLGRQWRFIKRKVVARVEAGLFGRGLDEDGKPVTAARKLRAA